MLLSQPYLDPCLSVCLDRSITIPSYVSIYPGDAPKKHRPDEDLSTRLAGIRINNDDAMDEDDGDDDGDAPWDTKRASTDGQGKDEEDSSSSSCLVVLIVLMPPMSS